MSPSLHSAVAQAQGVHLGDVAQLVPDSGLIQSTRLRKKTLRLRGAAGEAVAFVFSEKGHGAIAAALERALQRRAWQQTEAEEAGEAARVAAEAAAAAGEARTQAAPGRPPAGSGAPAAPQAWAGVPPKQPVFSTSSAGIAGIMRQVSLEESRANASVSEAFSDLSSLVDHARELVALATKMRGFERKSTSAVGADGRGGASPSSEEAAAEAELADWLLTLGLTSPVTKESAGSLYHQQLSRQLADFLPAVLERQGGIMTLPEVYCVYNRARGSELVSPADLLRACELWERLGLPLSLQTLGGVPTVCAARFSAEDMERQLVDMVESLGDGAQGLSAEDAAVVLACPPAVTLEVMRAAEQAGKVCRDELPTGLRWHRNFFLHG